MKNFLILQHEDITPPGSTLAWLEKNHFSYEIIPTSTVINYPDLNKDQHIIICGGTQNVDQEIQYPWLKKEKKFIASAIKNKNKILGLCLGAQLIAEVMGAKVFKAMQWEFGWQKIHFDSCNNHLFEKSRYVFQAHGYQFSLPDGTSRIAHSEACPNQGFLNNHTLAFQFHPEVDQAWIDLCLEGEEITGNFCQNFNDIRLETPQKIQSNISWYFSILDFFFLNK
ncbi:MAG: type 1 glutamine amidotransferase [Bdellovibrionaceae bacterium]|nr:type 1 glutamine amidotransferase [Pseudobdellovibrionaceae bacterium]NUM57695.1 type 1 glutamine amidotransferase [Pseudobdellovibrionaceae bacterium]